jgi:protein-serine/threonine kinase
MTMLIKYDTFSEDVTRFYLAECVLAIEAVHNLGFIHRQVHHVGTLRRVIH